MDNKTILDITPLDIEPGTWDEKTATFLREACADETCLDFLRQSIENKQCDLISILDNGKHVSSLVMQIEQNDEYKELVLLALAGSSEGRILATVNAFADNLAKKINANSIRAHIGSEALGKVMGRFDYEVSETIYRKMLAPKGDA